MKRIITIFLALLLLVFPLTAFADPPDVEEELIEALKADGTLDPEALDCGGAILVDARTGQVLFEKNADQQYFPASITKIMTCLLVLEYVEEHPEVMDSTITIEKTYYLEENAANIGTRIGEEFRFKDLIYGLMLASGNEIGIILGEEIAGDLNTFIDMMNARAQELGMVNTHYNNPHGLNDPTHLTTARDQSILAVEAMKNDLFREIVATDVYTCPETNKSDARRWSNHNKLMLGETTDDSQAYDKAIGIKTGYTSKAKCTLVSAAREEETGEEYIAVCMYGRNTEARFHSCRVMLEYGFTAYDQTDTSLYLDLFSGKDIAVPGAQEGYTLSYKAEGAPMYITRTVSDMEQLKADPTAYLNLKAELKSDLSAPIMAGDVVGSFTYTLGDQFLGTGNLIATNDVPVPEPDPTPTPVPTKAPAANKPGSLQQGTDSDPTSIWGWVALALFLVMLILVAALIVQLMMNRNNPSSRTENRRGGESSRSSAARSSRRDRRNHAQGTPRTDASSRRKR